MHFSEPALAALNPCDVDGLVSLVVKGLCDKQPVPFSEGEKKLIGRLVERAQVDGINHDQFNELLLLLRQNRVSSAFFEVFFRKGQVLLDELREAIVAFRGLAMLSYGNFTHPRRTLSRLRDAGQIRERLGKWGRSCQAQDELFTGRPEKILDITEIDRNHTWLNGELAARAVRREISRLSEIYLGKAPAEERKRFLAFLSYLVQLDSTSKEVQRRALGNTDIYLTWDYLDVYVATSMRNRWEFEETYDFIRRVFDDDRLKKLKLRVFDPTQCKCANPRDKGLLEGLMLKRAECTIYMAQESDTLGKDSELAATLAQGKPVIAYVPLIDPKSHVEKIARYPLDFFRKRLLIMYAEDVFDGPACARSLSDFDPDFEDSINQFLRLFAAHRGR
jgi:hypothetical protein